MTDIMNSAHKRSSYNLHNPIAVEITQRTKKAKMTPEKYAYQYRQLSYIHIKG